VPLTAWPSPFPPTTSTPATPARAETSSSNTIQSQEGSIVPYPAGLRGVGTIAVVGAIRRREGLPGPSRGVPTWNVALRFVARLAGLLLLLAAPGRRRPRRRHANLQRLQDKGLSLRRNAADLLMNATMGGACQGTFTKVQVTKGHGDAAHRERDLHRLRVLLPHGAPRGQEDAAEGLFSPRGNRSRTVARWTCPFTIGSRRLSPRSARSGLPKLYQTVGQVGRGRRPATTGGDFKPEPRSSRSRTPSSTSPPRRRSGAPGTSPGRRRLRPPASVALPRIQIYRKLEKAPVNADAVFDEVALPEQGRESGEAEHHGPRHRPSDPGGQGRAAPDGGDPAPLPARQDHGPALHASPPRRRHADAREAGGRDAAGVPTTRPLPLFESLVTDYDFQNSSEITNIRLDVYPDKNKNAGRLLLHPVDLQSPLRQRQRHPVRHRLRDVGRRFGPDGSACRGS